MGKLIGTRLQLDTGRNFWGLLYNRVTMDNINLPYIYLLKNCKIGFQLKYTERERERERKSSFCWFTSQISGTANVGPGCRQEPGTPSRSPKWISGMQVLELLPPAYQSVHQRKAGLEARFPGFKSGTPMWGASTPQGILIDVPMAHSF